jgi:hypothetical protein
MFSGAAEAAGTAGQGCRGRAFMGVTTRRSTSGARARRRPRRRSIVATILALDEDQVLFCGCAAGCADCDDE